VTQPAAPVVRIGHDRFRLRLDPEERRILAALVGELRAELDDPASHAPDGALARLFPPAFPDDPEAEASYVDLVHEDLAAARRERMALVESTIDADELDEAGAAAWLGVLNDARLVLGQSLGITEDDEGGDAGHSRAADPDAMRRAVFAYLGWLVSSFTDALAEGLPEVPDEVAVLVVHDAARPLLPEAVLERVVTAVGEGWDGAVPALPLDDTVKRADGEDVKETIDRTALYAVQTPQAFLADRLRGALGGGAEATDCAGLVEAAGGRVRLVEGDRRLLKVTTPADLVFVEALLGAEA
jgi:2-C-methyl-D-erythritol 4-phosphate cytidylyltransferase